MHPAVNIGQCGEPCFVSVWTFRLHIFTDILRSHGKFSDSIYRHAGIQGVGCYIFLKCCYISVTFISLKSRTANSVSRPIICLGMIFKGTSVFVGWLGAASWECAFGGLAQSASCSVALFGFNNCRTYIQFPSCILRWLRCQEGVSWPPLPGLRISCITFFCEILHIHYLLF